MNIKTAVISYLNEIISLTVLVLMAGALIAGQSDASGQSVDSVELEWATTSIRHDGE